MVRSTVRWLVLAGVLFAASARAADAPEFGASDLSTLNQALRALQGGKGRLERVYLLASAMQLDESGADRPGAKVAAATASARKLLTVFPAGEGMLLAMPNLPEFEALAKQYGSPADRELFRLLRRTYPDSHTPVYITQTGDHAHCTNLAPGVFVPLYGDWVKFARAHPDGYTDVVRREVAAIERELREGKCACTSARVATKALQAFAKAYPRGDVTPEVEGRLDQIRRRRPDIRFECLGLDQ